MSELNPGELISLGAALVALGFLMPLYTTLVIQNLWNWFLTDVFHAASMSYWQALGLVMIVKVFLYRVGERHEEQHEHDVGTALGLLERFGEPIGDAAVGTLALAVGWIVHTFFV